MAEIGNDIEKAKTLLEKGDLVGIPTETVYGLAGNALNPQAIARIFEVKNRPQFDPLIVHVADLSRTQPLIEELPPKALHLAEKFWPGPLTLLLKKKQIIPDLVTSGLDTVGLRCPAHPLTRQLLALLPFPLAAPSANPFGYVSPTQASHVNEQLGHQIKYILDGGSCSIGIESTIIGFDNDTPVIHRLGGLSVEEIESITGTVQFQLNTSSNPLAPGQLKSHYAPLKKVMVGNIAELIRKHKGVSYGILSFAANYDAPYQFILSPGGKLDEAAQNLFAALRSFDKAPVDVIFAEWVPDKGLGKAINDRLRRASSKPS